MPSSSRWGSFWLGRRVYSGMGNVRAWFGRYALRCVVFHMGRGRSATTCERAHASRVGPLRLQPQSDPFPGSKPDYPHHNPSLLLYERISGLLSRIRTFTNLGQTCWCNSLSQLLMCLLHHRLPKAT